MKILYCIPTLDYGGAERQLCYLAAELARQGHEVHVACGRRGPLDGALTSATLHDVGARRTHDPRLFFRLVRLMRRLKPDVVQTCLTQMDVAAGAAALLTRTPWVLREPSTALSYPRGWKTQLRRRLGLRADAIVANSPGGDAYWRDAGAARRHVVRNAIPFAEIDTSSTAPPAGRPLVLFAGRLDDGKNAGTLVEALARLDVDCEAIFCGDGPQRAELERRARELGLSATFPGYVANVLERMRGAAVVVSLSRYEGAPNVVMEAMACGTPLVVSAIDAHRHLLDDASALFAPPDDIAAAAAAIRTALLDRDAAIERARNARENAKTYSVEATARAYSAIYKVR